MGKSPISSDVPLTTQEQQQVQVMVEMKDHIQGFILDEIVTMKKKLPAQSIVQVLGEVYQKFFPLVISQIQISQDSAMADIAKEVFNNFRGGKHVHEGD